MDMTMERVNGNGQADAEEHGAEVDGDALDEARTLEAAALTGATAVALDPHVAFVLEQYDGMDHMGGD